uniref:Uncharacterized protein n=1 Tax=Ovis aries TaxID=9940 RepID=A0AC11EPI5_SHEEP
RRHRLGPHPRVLFPLSRTGRGRHDPGLPPRLGAGLPGAAAAAGGGRGSLRYSFSYRRISSYFMMAFAPPKNTNGPKMQTKMSTWTPLNHQLLNDWAFEERRALLGKWVAV